MTPIDICYTHKSVTCSAIIRAAFFCGRWELTQWFTTGQCAESVRLRNTQSDMGCLHQTSLLRAHKKSQRGWTTLRSSTLRKQQDWCTYEVTGTVAACTGATLVQTRWPPSLQWKWTKAPSPTQKLISDWHLSACKEKVGFLQWSITGYINHI